MDIKSYIFTTIAIVFFVPNATSQVTIKTIKGNLIKTSKIEVTSENGFQELKYLNKNGNERYLDYENIFSIQKENKKPEIVYKPTTEDPSLKVMNEMINGMVAARESNFAINPFITSYILGAWGGFLPKNQIFLAPFAPLAATFIFSFPFTEFPKHKNPVHLSTNEHFILGYQEQRRQKRIVSSILGGILGLGTGAVIYGIQQ